MTSLINFNQQPSVLLSKEDVNKVISELYIKGLDVSDFGRYDQDQLCEKENLHLVPISKNGFYGGTRSGFICKLFLVSVK